jgi:hypothetical protein
MDYQYSLFREILESQVVQILTAFTAKFYGYQKLILCFFTQCSK